MRIEISKLKENTFSNISEALVHAYKNRQYVLAQRRNDYVCILIPVNETYTILFDINGIFVETHEFVRFDDDKLYNWEGCTFTVIEREQVSLNVKI